MIRPMSVSFGSGFIGNRSGAISSGARGALRGTHSTHTPRCTPAAADVVPFRKRKKPPQPAQPPPKPAAIGGAP